MKNLTRRRLANAMKGSAVVLCLSLALRGHPPASAQLVPASTMKDAQQDQQLANLAQTADKTDRTLELEIEQSRTSRQRQWDRINEIADEQSSQKGEMRVEVGAIGTLMGGGMLLGREKKRKTVAD